MRRYLRFASAVIKVRDRTDLALKLLPVLSKRDLPFLAALLVRGAIRRLDSKPDARYRILVIEKAVFNEDIRVALGGRPELQIFGVGRAVLKAMAVGLLPRHLCADDTYISDDPVDTRAKLKYRRFLDQMWHHLARTAPFDAVITGNWAYWAEREFGAALESHQVPFIVLHKEGIKPPARSELLRHLFRKTRGQFMGRRMLVYQEAEREHQISGDIARPEQIVVVGMPRMDYLHAWRRRAAEGAEPARAPRPFVLFLAFLPNNFLPSYSGLESDLAWDELCAGSLRAMTRIARDNPDIDVLIRPRSHELPETGNLLSAAIRPDAALPPNLRLASDGEVGPLIKAAWVVVGHNTTVLLESLAAGKPVVVPHFAEAIDPRYAGYLVDVGPAAEHAICENDLARRTLAHCRNPSPIPADISVDAQAALLHWTGNADGNAAHRVAAAVLKEIDNGQR